MELSTTEKIFLAKLQFPLQDLFLPAVSWGKGFGRYYLKIGGYQNDWVLMLLCKLRVIIPWVCSFCRMYFVSSYKDWY